MSESRTGILLGILGTALGLVSLGLLFFLLSPGTQSALDVLPASATTVVLLQPTQSEIDAIEGWFPIVNTLPKVEKMDIALLRFPNAEQGWAIIAPKTIPLPAIAKTTTVTIGHLHAIASSKRVAAELSTTNDPKNPRMSSIASIRSITAHMPNETPWTLLHLPTLDTHLLEPLDHLALRLTDSTFAGLVHSGNRWTVLTDAARKEKTPTPIARELLATGTGVIAEVHMSDPLIALSAVSDAVQTTTRLVAQGLLGDMLRTTVGADTSPFYDLLPLIGRDTAVLMSKNKMNQMEVLVHGRTTETAVQDRLTTLIRAAAQTFPRTTAESHTFDRGFATTILKSDANALEEKKEQIGGWVLQSIESADGTRSVAAGVRGNRVLLSTDAAWARAFLQADRLDQPSLPHSLTKPGTLVAGGRLDVSALPLLRSAFPIVWPSSDLLPALKKHKGSILWSIEEKDGIRAITVEL